MIQKIFKKRTLAGITGFVLFINHLGQSFFYPEKIGSYLTIGIFSTLLLFKANKKTNENSFAKLMSDNLQLTTASFFSFMIFLLFFQFFLNFSESQGTNFTQSIQSFFPTMVNQAYKKAIFFIPLSFIFGLIFSFSKNKESNEDILDENID